MAKTMDYDLGPSIPIQASWNRYTTRSARGCRYGAGAFGTPCVHAVLETQSGPGRIQTFDRRIMSRLLVEGAVPV